ncbi:hypothetical protein BDZ94DRAFT_1255954 [Collybia nuda]|uniref:Uncharacterized protein n=1 Tax=Collybia nuda TaxID=64659 RepID=A0A9P5Y935_9AGAR|nr:hypothetical protein BDZ94DRAFT_1255954 [Collybia nuda]
MSHHIINIYLFVLAFLYFQSFALTLHSPTTPIPYGLYFNLTWTAEREDPATIRIISTNLNTAKSSLLANVNISDGNVLTRIMPDTPSSLPGLFSLQAVDSHNTARILDTFNLATIPTAVSSTKHEGSHLGAIIGGIFGSLAAMTLLVVGFLIHRRNHRHNHTLSIRIPDIDERVAAQTQQGPLQNISKLPLLTSFTEWETQVHGAMAKAHQQSSNMGSQPSSRVHNRLGSSTNTASVTSDDL